MITILKKYFFISVLTLLLPLVSYCNNIGEKTLIPRDTTKHFKKNVIYIEELGNAPLISINYERMFSFKSMKNSQFSFRVGLGYLFYMWSNPVNCPIMINYIYGKRSFKFYCGLGAIFPKNVLFQGHYTATASLGLRIVKQFEKTARTPSFFMNLGFTPSFEIPIFNNDFHYYDGIAPFFGLGIGIAF